MHGDSSARHCSSSAHPIASSGQRWSQRWAQLWLQRGSQRWSQRRPFALLTTIWPRLLAWVFATLLLACDESFTPIASTDLQFSVFGYFDASADTQWVRVMPFRPQVPATPDSFQAVVTLEHVATGRTIALRDSVFRFTQYNHPDVGSEGLYLHNFWTTERVEPGASYRFSVRRSGEEPSEAVVEIPRDYEVEVWLRQTWSQKDDLLRLAGLKHVPFVRATTYFYDRCGSFVESVSFKIPSADGEVRSIPVSKASVPARGACGAPLVEKRVLWTVGSEIAWPSGPAYSTSALVPWEGASNISNSLGFVGGVLTRSVPFESCVLEGPAPLPDHCRLRYDAASATLRGTVAETRCSLGPFDSLLVTLREVRQPTAVRRVRTTLTNRLGEFEIAGLEAGVRHVLTVRPPTRRDERGFIIDLYTQHTDTLEFTPGEQKRYDIGLRRLDECSVR